jgi:type IV pilus assembly protein PilW
MEAHGNRPEKKHESDMQFKLKHCLKNAFTLVELLIALALAAMATAAIYKAFQAQQSIYQIQDQLSEAEQNLRAALDIMVREIRMAGYDPQSTANAGITLAESNAIQFTADLNGNGHDFATATSANNPNEKITFTFASNSLRREVWGGGAQVLAGNIDALNLVYLNKYGSVIATPVTDLEQIRSIQITIVARANKQDKNFRNSSQYTNSQGEVVLASQNDGYRRRALTTTVRCRNMGL